MDGTRTLKQVAAALAVAALACAACGCAQLGAYAKYRGEDALEMADIGVTVSKKPQFAAYANGVSVLTGGYAKLDGTFVGLGGGQFGATRHYTHDVGAVAWGYEEFGWGTFDAEVPGTLDRQHVGALGILTQPGNRRPSYAPACVHYLHLGVVGFVGNLRYLEMLDFMLGFAAIDIAGDDGTKYSAWPWQRKRLLTRFEPLTDEPYTVCSKCGKYHSLPKGADGPGGTSPFDKLGGAKEPKPDPPLCRGVAAPREPQRPAAVVRRPTLAPATPAPTTGTLGGYDPAEARRLSEARP